MSTIATIRVLCETNPSLESAVVNGLLAWAGTLGGLTAFGSGLYPRRCLHWTPPLPTCGPI
jgi:hypothetical protein